MRTFFSWAWPYLLAAALVLFAMGLYGAYSHGVTVTDASWQARWAEQGQFQAKAAAAAETSARAEEQRRQNAANQVGKNAKDQSATAAADAAGADAVGDSVRHAATKLATDADKLSCDTATAERGASVTRAAMVLSDLFQRADKRAGELAQAYDQARIAGLACESAYQSMQNP